MSDLPPYSPEDQTLLDALRDEPGPTSADRDRVRAAVLATVGTVVAAGGSAKAATAAKAGGGAKAATAGGGAKAAAATAAAKTGILGLPLKVGMAAVLIAASGATGWWWSQGPSEGPLATAAAPSVVAEPRVDPAPEASEPEVDAPAEAVPEEPDEAVAEAPADGDVVEPAEPSAVAPASAPPATADDLAAEVALMREVQAAMASGDHRQALRRLDEHARRFPRGALSAERNGARAITYCRMGRGRATGRALAARLLAANPSSLMAARLREACGLPTETKEAP